MNINNFMTINMSQRSAALVCVGLITLVLSTMGYICWQWRNDWLLARHQPAALLTTKSKQSSHLIASIPNSHLFGISQQKLGDVPVSNLQFSVTGIVKVNPDPVGSVSKAYISLAGQPGKIYKPGDNLPYGVKIHDITSLAVVLENNGHLEKLPLPRQQLTFKQKETTTK